MKPTQFTFKTEKTTGPYRSFFPNHHCIKLKKKVVGQITDRDGYKIRLKVVKADINEDGNPNCTWKWITLKKEFETLQEAKDFLNANFEAIMAKFPIYIDND